MPRYYFNVLGEHPETDQEGIEFHSREHAWEQAVRTCGEMIRQRYRTMQPPGSWRMDVNDEKGRQIFSLRFAAIESDREN